MALWNKKPLKVYGGRMSESILSILCHIVKGESVIKVSAHLTPHSLSHSQTDVSLSILCHIVKGESVIKVSPSLTPHSLSHSQTDVSLHPLSHRQGRVGDQGECAPHTSLAVTLTG